MRKHWWSFLLNEEGQPIQNADISVYLAGTETAVLIYKDEFSTESEGTAPQITSNQNGYFEFWLPDINNVDYDTTQKFKIEWNKTGIEYGYIDYIDIYPSFTPVDESNTDDTKDKTVSNELANLWESHRLDDSNTVHGLEEVNEFDSVSETKNKLINNALSYKWNEHTELEFYTDSISGSTYVMGSSGTSVSEFPHSIEPLDLSANYDITDFDYWKRNKLISYQQGKTWNDYMGQGQPYSYSREGGYSVGDTVYDEETFDYYICKLDQPEGSVISLNNEVYWSNISIPNMMSAADGIPSASVYVDENGNTGFGTKQPHTKIHNTGAYTQQPLSSDPSDPDNGNSVQWVSDGTGTGDVGDVMIKINVGGTVKTITLIDYSSY